MNPVDEKMEFEQLIPDQQTPGQMLKFARERAKFSHIEVARELKLKVQWIVDIENDEYQDAAALIYVRGYLRSYAKLLNLSQEEVIGAFCNLDFEQKFRDKAAQNRERRAVGQFVKNQPVLPYTRVERRPSLRKIALWGGAVIVVVAAGLLLNWWYQHRTVAVSESPAVDLPVETNVNLTPDSNLGPSSNLQIKPASPETIQH